MLGLEYHRANLWACGYSLASDLLRLRQAVDFPCVRMDENDVKVIVGLALADSYDSCDSCIDILKRLWDDCRVVLVEEAAKEFLDSPDENVQDIGFLLQSVSQVDFPDPDPGEAKDLALDIREIQIPVIDLMYSLRLIQQTDVGKQRKIAEVYPLVQKWQARLGSAASAIREGDWTNAKKSLNSAYIVSNSSKLPDIFADIFDLYKATVSHLQEKTENLRTRMLAYPSRTNIPTNRTEIILQVQAIYINLLDLQQQSKMSQDIFDVISYPIEKLGVAVHYLLSTHTTVQDANYEIGLAASNLKRNLSGTSGPIRQELSLRANELDVLFSKLPAKPWPVEGFGSPDVESRFGADSER
jgi:hypothetical protein